MTAPTTRDSVPAESATCCKVPDRAHRTSPRPPNVDQAADQAGRPAIFTAHALSKTYLMGEVKVQALVDVDLTIYRGEFIVLLGPPSSGQSTLLNILGGLNRPSSGIAHFAEHDLTAANESQLTQYRREHVGFVFQFYNLIPSLSVRENVELVTDIADHPMPAEEALGLVGLADRMDHFSSQLSGGEAARGDCACDRDHANAAIAGMADQVLYLGGGRIQRVEQNTRKLKPSERSW